ncbi:MAG: hypothetical protein V1776_03480 [Candidatus Diapherotrites archaeon]
MKMNPLYDKSFKRLMILPAVLTVIFLIIILVAPGVTLGLDFAGGTRIVVNTDKLQEQPVKDLLSSEFGLPDSKVTIVSSPFGTSARIEYAEPKNLSDSRVLLEQAIAKKTSNPSQSVAMLNDIMSKLNQQLLIGNDPELLIPIASKAVNDASAAISAGVQESLIGQFGLPSDTPFTVEQVTPTFGASFLANTIFVAIVSIILLTIVIFIFFRELIPSLAVVEAALFDMLTALALLTLFGFSITLSTVAALLMLVGYSVDTDILLTTRVLKRRDKTVLARANDTLMTGLTVTSTLMGAAMVMLIVSWSAQMTTIFEISATILFGLMGDLVATWFTNAPILLWYWEKKNGSVEAAA